MPKKPVIDHEEKDSLVPSISREEDRLKSYLEAAAASARQLVTNAQQAAEERERNAREELPQLMERQRAESLAASRTRAQSLRAELAAQTAALLKKAEENCQKAASIVVSAVWPGDPR